MVLNYFVKFKFFFFSGLQVLKKENYVKLAINKLKETCSQVPNLNLGYC